MYRIWLPYLCHSKYTKVISCHCEEVVVYVIARSATTWQSTHREKRLKCSAFFQYNKFYPFLVKKLMHLASARVMPLQWSIATLFNVALPKIVMPAITAEINDEIRIVLKSPLESIIILATIDAPAAPDKIPHTSPTISLHTELTLSAFLINAKACLLPLTFLAAMAVKGSWVHVATAIPTMSNNMLTITNTRITITDIMIVALLSAISLRMLNENERTMDNISVIIGHTHSFFVFVLSLVSLSLFIYSTPKNR